MKEERIENLAEDEREKKRVEPFHKLFSFADRKDVALMVVGISSAAANGLTQPFIILLFGDLINAFGSTDPDHMLKTVSKVRLGLFICFCKLSIHYYHEMIHIQIYHLRMNTLTMTFRSFLLFVFLCPLFLLFFVYFFPISMIYI